MSHRLEKPRARARSADPATAANANWLALLRPELAEVLAPAVNVRILGGRLMVAARNPTWAAVVHQHAAVAATSVAQALGLGLSLPDAGDAGRVPGSESFSGFLSDPGNQLAAAACREAIAAPGLAHSPLYLHGPPGCGKSYLLAAATNEAVALLGADQVVVLDGASFVARDAQDLASRSATPLRTRLERAAVISCDDVHLLASYPLAQEELFNLINRSLEHGQQLLFAGPLAPRRINGLEERLATRLAWGLAVSLEAPLVETRVALLRRLAGPAADALPSSELSRLVERFAPDLHHVERLAARLRSGDNPASDAGDAVSIDRIISVVADACGLRPSDIAGKRRHRAVADARHIVLWLARRLTNHSLEALGALLGGRDHSTVLHGIRRIDERQRTDTAFQQLLTDLTRQSLAGV